METRPAAIPSAKPLTVRVASWSARHRWPVVAAWFIFTFGLFATSLFLGGTKTLGQMGGGVPRTESALADQVFSAGGQSAPHEDLYLVVRNPDLATTDPAYRAAVGDMIGRLAAVTDPSGQPAVAPLADPYAAPASAGLMSADGTSIRIVATIVGDPSVVTEKASALRPVLASLAGAHPGYEVHALSNTLISEDLNRLIGDDLDGSLKVTLPITFLILLVAFGAAVAAAVPLVLALSALLAGFGILGIYSQLVAPVAMSTSQLVVLIGLAVGVDYSLFMITRFRSERRAGKDKLAAIETASGTAGRAVFFSGLAVAVSLAGLFLIRVDMLNSMAVAMIGVVLVAVIGSLTFLPATLSILGDRVNRGRVPFLGRDRAEGTGDLGEDRQRRRSPARDAWPRGRRPGCSSSRARSATCGWARPTSTASRRASTASPRSTCSTPNGRRARRSSSRSSSPQRDQPATQAAIDQLKIAGLRDGGVGEPVTVQASADGSVARVSFVMPGDQNDPANQATVERFRSTVLPAVFDGCPASMAYVTVTPRTCSTKRASSPTALRSCSRSSSA